MKRKFIIYFYTACCVFTSIYSTLNASDIDGIQIRGKNFGNCWIKGETVTFQVHSELPKGTTKVIGTVFNSAGKEIASKTVSAETFTSSGWDWKPKVPGFYKVRFYWAGNNGTTTPAQETIHCRVYKWIKGKPHLKLHKDFFRKFHNIAVLPSPTRPPSEISKQLAVSLNPAHEKKAFRFKWANDNIKLAALMGFHTIRIHPIAWTLLQPERTKYEWSYLDEFIKEARKNGFKDFIGNPFGTPQWASPHPDQIAYNICVWKYSSYAPARLSNWQNFLKALIKRYPFIKNWELWNEPHLPGQSCFWSDTPENYVKLLKSGYETIKKLQPDSTIWLAGMGMRYLPFYKKIMKLGAGKYFDVIALHGSWASPVPFEKITREAGNKPKPWVSSEWHAMLASESQPVTPSDEALSQRMLIDFMNHIRQGAEIVTFFTTSNIPHGREQEMMEFFRKNKQFHQTYGLFRGTPYFEPRLMAVVWRNFSDCFAGKIKYLEGYYFENTGQYAALMESARGKVLFFWSNSKTPAKTNPALTAAISQRSILLDWEGRLQNPQTLTLQPKAVYFLKNPDIAATSSWKRGQVLKPWRKKPKLDHSYNGYYRKGKLFDGKMNIIDAQNLPLQHLSKYITKIKNQQPSHFSSSFAVGIDEEGIDVLVNVSDQVHNQTHTDGNIWQGDSIQFAIDTTNKGFVEDKLEISAAKTLNGPLLWKESMPSMNGDLPDKISKAQTPIKYGKIKIETHSGGLRYKIHIDRKDLYPFSYLPGTPLRFSILVNNNDGNGREGYLEWASGIGKSKAPAEYGTLTVYVGKQSLFSQSALCEKWGTAKLKLQNNTVKVTSPGGKGQASAVATATVKAVPGARYNLSFQARGSLILYGMVHISGKKNKRLDFLQGIKLDNNWTPYQTVFTVPSGTQNLRISLYSWQEAGWFEIKEFTVTPAASNEQ